MSKKPWFLWWLQRATALALVLGVHACALWPQADEPPSDTASTAGAADNSNTPTNGAAPLQKERSFDIDVQVDDKQLKTLLEKHNGLQRYQAVPDLEAYLHHTDAGQDLDAITDRVAELKREAG